VPLRRLLLAYVLLVTTVREELLHAHLVILVINALWVRPTLPLLVRNVLLALIVTLPLLLHTALLVLTV